jgi:hypothetical protein
MAGRFAVCPTNLFKQSPLLFQERAEWVLLATTHRQPPGTLDILSLAQEHILISTLWQTS